MKIGILTFSNAYNYGAALQAFSLQQKMREMGVDAGLINYHCAAIDKMHAPKTMGTSRSVKKIIYNSLNNVVFYKRRKRFQTFWSQIVSRETYTRETIAQTNNIYDRFFTGSDQVFNLKLTDYDTSFFLDFAPVEKKVAYAASVGTYLPEKKELYRQLLSGFRQISVREKSSAELFQKELGISATVLPDPVFLHTGEEWRQMFNVKQTEKQDYVLVYSLIENKELYELAEHIAKQRGLRIVVITKALFPAGKADRFIRDAGPKEFVSLIANAAFVVTNSFHGTAFSLIFQKQFVTLLPSAAPDRINNLLNETGLTEHAYVNLENIHNNLIDYSAIGNKIQYLKQAGEEYLQQII